MVTPRELEEEEAVGNWCENITLKCTVEDESSSSKTKGIRQAEDILGESSTPYVPSIPPPSSVREHHPPPATKAAPEEIDCCVADGSHCCVHPGMSTFTAQAA
jgi:hypothetical protein